MNDLSGFIFVKKENESLEDKYSIDAPRPVKCTPPRRQNAPRGALVSKLALSAISGVRNGFKFRTPDFFISTGIFDFSLCTERA